MSFYNERGNGVYPGQVQGNPSAGLSHRVAVSVQRVLDSCMKQETAEGVKLKLTSKEGNFISANQAQSSANVTDLSIARLAERPEFARIKCNVVIPMRVTLGDSKDEQTTADSSLSIAQDVILYVPKNSIFPFEIKAVAAVNCPSGKVSDENTCVVTACYTIILKVVADTDLLIPTYGFCPTPQAVDFAKDESNDFFDLPLYPSGR